MYDYDDFYREPSEFEQEIEELKSKLSQSVKKEIMDELESLRKENAELRPIKEDISKLEREYYNKKVQLEREYDERRRNIRKERISELLKDYDVEYWGVHVYYEDMEKCNKCDKNRRIHYKTPLGKDEFERCDCADRIAKYKPISQVLKTFSFRYNEAQAWYRIRYEGTDEEYLEYESDSIYKGDNFITEENQINVGKIINYKAIFKTKELAQMYCDLKNKENDAIKEFELEEIEDDGIKKRNF